MLKSLPQETYEEHWEKVRLTFLMALGYFGALRNHELEKNTMGCFRKLRDWQTGKDLWWMHILGKGNKLREVPVNDALLGVVTENLLNFRDQDDLLFRVKQELP